MTAKTNPDGSVVSYEYDIGRLTAVVLPGGARESFGYDALGRRTSMANSEVSLSFVYDALNRMTQATNHTLGQTIGYGYDAAGNRTSMDGPLGQVTYLYDAKNRLVEQHDPASGVYRLAYDAADRRSGLTYPNGVTTEYDYDQANRLTDLLTRDPQGNVLDGYAYTYDAVGNRTQMRSLRDSAVHDYTYDSVDRLTRWQRGPDRFEAYAYDEVGNRQQLEDERGVITYSYDDANRLLQEVRTLTGGGTTTTTDYGWDPNGNLLTKQVEGGSLTTYTWDALNRLTSVTDATGLHTYGYDPQGIRVRETNGADTTRLLHAGEDIVGTYKSGTLDTYFAHGPGIDEPWAQVRPNATTDPIAYLHRDGLGSVTAISNPQGQLAGATTYAPFGGVESTTGPTTRYGYTSRELDPTGLMYYRARYYEAEAGRFVDKDSWRGNLEHPSTQNRFAYVNNTPAGQIDPWGHFGIISTALGVLFGAAWGARLGLQILPFQSRRVRFFWGAFIGAVVAFIILTGVASLWKIDSNFWVFFQLNKLSETQIQWTLFSRLFGRFFAVHYGKHIGGKISFHLHIGESTVEGLRAAFLGLLLLGVIIWAVNYISYTVVLLYEGS